MTDTESANSPHLSPCNLLSETLRVLKMMEINPIVESGCQKVQLNCIKKEFNPAIAAFILSSQNQLGEQFSLVLDSKSNSTVLKINLPNGVNCLPVSQIRTKFLYNFNRAINLLTRPESSIKFVDPKFAAKPVNFLLIVPKNRDQFHTDALVLETISTAFGKPAGTMALSGNEDVCEWLPKIPYLCVLIREGAMSAMLNGLCISQLKTFRTR